MLGKFHFYFFTITLFLLFEVQGEAQIINTVAGNGGTGYSGDGGQATAAQLYWPSGVTVDGNGNIYVADFANNVLRKVNTSGIITTIAGTGYNRPFNGGFSGDGGSAIAAELYRPVNVKVDALGNIYFTDTDNCRIRKINTSGIITTIAGSGTCAWSGDGGPATAADMNEPYDLCFDLAGNMYFSDNHSNRIRMINTNGIISTVAGNGIYGYSGDGGPATAAEFNFVSQLAIDGSGNLYVDDSFNNCLRMINTNGIIFTIAGNGIAGFSGDGGPATAAELNQVFGVCLDGSGNLYITDDLNNRIRMVDASGIITTIVGNGTAGFSGDGGPATAAELNGPGYLAIRGPMLYIVDGDNRIRAVTGMPTNANYVFSIRTKVQVYPNPNNGNFTLSLSNTAEKSTIEIFNMLGEKVYTKALTESNTQLTLSNSAAGVYLYRVISETGNLVSEGKFIIQK